MASIHDIKNDKNLVTLPLKHCILKKSRDTAPLTADKYCRSEKRDKFIFKNSYFWLSLNWVDGIYVRFLNFSWLPTRPDAHFTLYNIRAGHATIF